MEFSDSTIVEEAPIVESPRALDPSLMAEARIKAKRLREFLEETIDEIGTGHEPASHALIRDYNGLRAFVAEASPRLVAILPPEITLPMPGLSSGSGPNVAKDRDLLFFCKQIEEFLEQEKSQNPTKRLDNGSSLFGPNGLKHEPALLAAARIKADSLQDFVKKQWCNSLSGLNRVPVSVLEDYNRLHALIRTASPEIESVLPPEILIPADPKPRMEDQPAPSTDSWFFSWLKRGSRPKTIRYQELLFHCQQIVRLLK